MEILASSFSRPHDLAGALTARRRRRGRGRDLELAAVGRLPLPLCPCSRIDSPPEPTQPPSHPLSLSLSSTQKPFYPATSLRCNPHVEVTFGRPRETRTHVGSWKKKKKNSFLISQDPELNPGHK